MKLAMVLAPDYLDKLLCYLQCFFFKTKERNMEVYSSQTQHPVFKSLQHYIGKLKLTVLLVLTTEQTFNMAHLHCDFHFPQKAFVKSYCYRRPIKYFLL